MVIKIVSISKTGNDKMVPFLRSSICSLRSGRKRLYSGKSVAPDTNARQKPNIEAGKSKKREDVSDHREEKPYLPPRETADFQAKSADETITDFEEFDDLEVGEKCRHLLDNDDDGTLVQRLSSVEWVFVINACVDELNEVFTNDLGAAMRECHLITQALNDTSKQEIFVELETLADSYSNSHVTEADSDVLNTYTEHCNEREEIFTIRRRKKRRIRFTHIKRYYLKNRKVPLLPGPYDVAAVKLENMLDDQKTDVEENPTATGDGIITDGVEITTDEGRLGLSHDDERDEMIDYEPYRFNSDRDAEMKDSNADDADIEDLFRDLFSLRQDGCSIRKEEVDVGNSSNTRTCEHKRIWGEEVGWYCDLCGFVIEDIQQIFIAEIPHRIRQKGPSCHQQQFGGDSDLESEVDTLKRGSVEGSEGLRLKIRLHPFHENVLKRHQKEGFQFLTRNLVGDESIKREPGGCILAHAPGTGKTLLTISFVHSFLTALPGGRVLIVAPKIMLRVWQKEFELWNVEVIPVYNLNECSRTEISTCTREMDMKNKKKSAGWYLRTRRLNLIKEWLGQKSVLLLSYNLFASLILTGLKDESNCSSGSLRQAICQGLLTGPELMVLDEGHFPRTKRTKISQALMRVHTRRRVLLSGTLFQNNFKELFNLLKLVSHDFLSSVPEFTARLTALEQKKRAKFPSAKERATPGVANATEEEMNMSRRKACEEQIFMEEIGFKLEEFVRGAENFTEIHSVIRRLRSLTSPIVHWYPGKILDELPGLMEFVVYLNLTSHQEQLQSHLKCKKGLEQKTRLAEICIHPALVKSGDHSVTSALSASQNLLTFLGSEDPNKGVKTAFLVYLLRLCKSLGERVLIFSQTLAPLALIAAMLTRIFGWEKGVDFLSLDGTMQSDDRQRVIEHFNDEENRVKVLLASISACKEGISLVGASRIVILDVLWNPSVVRQAVSRAFRLGQKRKVFVYKLVAADTMEETMFHASMQKDWFSRVLLDQSLNTIEGGYHDNKILYADQTCSDSLLQEIVRNDTSNRINRIRRYNTRSELN